MTVCSMFFFPLANEGPIAFVPFFIYAALASRPVVAFCFFTARCEAKPIITLLGIKVTNEEKLEG